MMIYLSCLPPIGSYPSSSSNQSSPFCASSRLFVFALGRILFEPEKLSIRVFFRKEKIMKLFKAIALAQLAQAEVLFKEDFSQGKFILIYVEIY